MKKKRIVNLELNNTDGKGFYMKRCMTDYAGNLCNYDDIDILYKVICLKYKRFIDFYRLVEESSDYIESLDYDDSDKDSLNIIMTLNNNDKINEIYDNIKERSESYNATISLNKGTIFIELSN